MPELDTATNTWAPAAQSLYWRELVVPPFGVASLALCIVAQIVYYAFPRQRIFPRSMLSWLNLYNMIFAAYEIWKWLPSSVLHHSWTHNINPASLECRISLFLDHLTTIGPTACATLIALTVFLVITTPCHLENHRTVYFYGYLAFATVYPVGMGLIASFTTTKQKSCAVSYAVRNVLVLPNFCFYGLQAVLIVFALFKVRQVMNSIHSIGRNNFPFKYLIAKLIITYIYQSFYLIPIQVEVVWYLREDTLFSRFAFISRSLGPFLDALTFMLLNPDLLNWLQLQIERIRKCLRKVLHPRLPSKETCENLHAAYCGTHTVSIQVDGKDPTAELERLEESTEDSGVNSAALV